MIELRLVNLLSQSWWILLRGVVDTIIMHCKLCKYLAHTQWFLQPIAKLANGYNVVHLGY